MCNIYKCKTVIVKYVYVCLLLAVNNIHLYLFKFEIEIKKTCNNTNTLV